MLLVIRLESAPRAVPVEVHRDGENDAGAEELPSWCAGRDEDDDAEMEGDEEGDDPVVVGLGMGSG
jgi:hypothetical protein